MNTSMKHVWSLGAESALTVVVLSSNFSSWTCSSFLWHEWMSWGGGIIQLSYCHTCSSIPCLSLSLFTRSFYPSLLFSWLDQFSLISFSFLLTSPSHSYVDLILTVIHVLTIFTFHSVSLSYQEFLARNFSSYSWGEEGKNKESSLRDG